MAQVFHYKSMGRLAQNKTRKPTVELCSKGTALADFKLVYRPWTELRAGLSGSSEKGFDPTTGRVVPLGNPIMLHASRFQSDVVSVEDAVTGEQITVCWNQAQTRRIINQLRQSRQPKPAKVVANA